MNQPNVSVDEWIDMFRSVGLDEEQMSIWHREFEKRHPDAHEEFLRWLDLPVERIHEIRARAGTSA